ncbi:unnamed protein product [Spirodela intermedia]|uniref:L-gulonolactone oxidase 2-like C-terminal domain-containing protein n=1 Tax=Spirodela intermedia TaxID=51605 RepID=A0ABN7EDG9_SPIIN|nr:unnamed protein product [Spirodela intermedia]
MTSPCRCHGRARAPAHVPRCVTLLLPHTTSFLSITLPPPCVPLFLGQVQLAVVVHSRRRFLEGILRRLESTRQIRDGASTRGPTCKAPSQEPMFKRSITYRVQRDQAFESTVSSFATTTEFGDIAWYPGREGGPQLSVLISTLRKSELERQVHPCQDPDDHLARHRRRPKNHESSLTDFTEYPVVGNQSEMQSSGSCLTASPLPDVAAFVADVKKLHAQRPGSLCGRRLCRLRHDLLPLERPEDPPLDQDILEEVEQMAFFKYGAVPHWGKNRHVGFIAPGDKYGDRRDRFVAAMVKYDGEGLFSSDWTDAVLGIRGKSFLCICSRDEHCAPAKGYFCLRGLVYEDARVCGSRGRRPPIVHIEL